MPVYKGWIVICNLSPFYLKTNTLIIYRFIDTSVLQHVEVRKYFNIEEVLIGAGLFVLLTCVVIPSCDPDLCFLNYF